MKAPRSKRFWLGLVVVIVVVGAGVRATGGHSVDDIPAGTGYSSWELCTRTLVSGEDFDHVRTSYVEPKVSPLPRLWAVDRSRPNAVAVSTRLPLLTHARAAIFRDGLGCTLLPPGTTEAGVRAQPFHRVAPLADNISPWPQGEGPVESRLLDAALGAVINRHAKVIFGEPSRELRKRGNTTALLVAQNGHLLYERYAHGYDREAPQLGWSMTKTLTAMLAGVMAHDGKLALDTPVGLASWNGTPKEKITWRQLLNMAPGLAWFEGYGGASDATEMLFSQADQGAWAASLPMTSEPGTVFTYSTGFSNVAMLRMKQLVGGTHQQIYDYYQARLFSPLGIRNAVIEPDASGTPVGGARGMLRAVDWLRLGQLLLNEGNWNGVTIMSRDHVSFMTAASPASDLYGGSMWRQPSDRLVPEVRDRLPKDTVWFAGHLGQFVIVVPSKQLLVLRTGVAIDDAAARDKVFALAADLVTSR